MFQSNIVHCFLLHHHYQLSSYFFSTPMLWVLFPLSSISSSPSLLFCDHCHDYCFLVRLCTIFFIIIMSSPLLSSHSSLSRSSSSFVSFYFPLSSPAQPPTERSEVQVPARAEIWFEIYAIHAPLARSAMRSKLTVYCELEDEMARERTGHPSHICSYY